MTDQDVIQPHGAARVVGRYALYSEIAAGGMASVHVARLLGPVGFSRTVAIKRLHPHFAREPDFVTMFLDEARLAARIRHPNVVPTLDVVAEAGELFLVMEYVQGESLSQLLKAVRQLGQHVPRNLAASIMAGVLHGLHAAHETRNERGGCLNIVHRDMSPQNVLVGVDGVARVVDFGVAKAVGRLQNTREGTLKGKLPYMAPEQVNNETVSRATDIFALGAVMWETIVGRRLFRGENDATILHALLDGVIDPPSKHVLGLHPSVDSIVMRALERDPAKRWPTAHDMALAIEAAMMPAPASKVGAWVSQIAGDKLAHRSKIVEEVESISSAVDITALRQAAHDLTPASVSSELRTPPVPLDAVGEPLSTASASISGLIAPPSRPSPVKTIVAVSAVALVLGVVAIGGYLLGRSPSAPRGGATASQPALSTPVASAPPAVSSPSPETSASAAAEVAPQPSATASARPGKTPGKTGKTAPLPTGAKTAKPGGVRDDLLGRD
jgi:eukaryotic-like serine/threonine-protein kinase